MEKGTSNKRLFIYTPKQISKIGGLILFLVPQIVTLYFFYGVVPHAIDGHGHGEYMYGGPPKFEYAKLLFIYF